MKMSEDPSIPVLEDKEHPGERWVNITEAAELLGITRQHSYKRAKTGGYTTLHRIGSQPAYVISTSEINALLAAKAEKERVRSEKADAVETVA